MQEHQEFTGEDLTEVEQEASGGIDPTLPIQPLRFRVSGLYTASGIVKPPIPIPQPIPVPQPLPTQPIPIPQPLPSFEATQESQGEIEHLSPKIFLREELRLDVDGRYPQMMASGTLYRTLATRVDWIANLRSLGPNSWSGTIWYKNGDVASFPYSEVQITTTSVFLASQRKATVRYSGGGAAIRSRTFTYRSPYFRNVEFEFDSATGVTPVTKINTHAHPNRPATMPKETLRIETVYRRAGFRVGKSGGDTVVPLTNAGSNAQWSDNEMHDAMQVYWSRFAAKAQWSLWVFFAALHEQGNSLGGIMFDDIGQNHRQGTAIFNDSFISTPPAGDANPAAWVQRMRFWTACHEMGHAFNLAHSWQKEHPPTWGTPWIPLANEPEARSFMNYPYNVSGGQTAFFSDFEYRFSDNELIFMRHAPERFVQMGNADWFDQHGFDQSNRSSEPTLKLNLRVDRANATYQFLEPVVLELKLTNVGSRPIIVDKELLSMTEYMTVIVKKRGKAARQYLPFARYCYEAQARVVMPGEMITDSLFVSVGQNGWDIAEPGYYTVQIALHMETEDIVSDPIQIRVAPPRGYEEEFLAQDFFTEEVGRILNFDGSAILRSGNNVLREVCERFGDRAVAYHSRIALAGPLARDYKVLSMGDRAGLMASVKDTGGQLRVTSSRIEEARRLFADALLENKEEAIATLGLMDYEYYLSKFSHALREHGATSKKEGKEGKRETRRDKNGSVEGMMKVIKEILSELKEHAQASR
jgi:hypothetical protein